MAMLRSMRLLIILAGWYVVMSVRTNQRRFVSA